MIAVEDHVHALKDEALVVVLERQDTLAAQNIRTLFLHQVLHPRKEFVRIERLFAFQRNRLHLLVGGGLEPAVRKRMVVVVVVMMIVIMAVTVVMIVVVVVIVIVAFEESRLEIEDTVEIESVAAQH